MNEIQDFGLGWRDIVYFSILVVSIVTGTVSLIRTRRLAKRADERGKKAIKIATEHKDAAEDSARSAARSAAAAESSASAANRALEITEREHRNLEDERWVQELANSMAGGFNMRRVGLVLSDMPEPMIKQLHSLVRSALERAPAHGATFDDAMRAILEHPRVQAVTRGI